MGSPQPNQAEPSEIKCSISKDKESEINASSSGQTVDELQQKPVPLSRVKFVARKLLGKNSNSKRRKLKSAKNNGVGKLKQDPASPLSDPLDVKKMKRSSGASTPHNQISDESDATAVPSVPSVASTEDSDLPDSVMSPTDEETCSYVTDDECPDDQSIVSSVTSVSNMSGASSPRGRPAVISNSAVTSELQEIVTVPALRFSEFPNVPPFLNFCLHDEKAVELPWTVRRHLKWKHSTITPLVVRKTILNSGFRLIKEPKEWIGTWGKHMKSPMFQEIQPHQKVNHFPGTFQIGRKDRLWRNIQKMVSKYGEEEFGFLPQTYILPHDIRQLRSVWSRNTTDVPWIIKPPASARGTGIQVIHQWSQLPRKRPLVVQSYLQNPYLIHDTKFDMRIYVYVTSINPLRIYMYEDGLVRFASNKYSSEMSSLQDLFTHLTNYSINKNCEDYVSNEDATACQGHKWTLKSLWRYLTDIGVDVPAIRQKLKDLVIKTLLSAEHLIHFMSKANLSSRYQCYELFGFDVILDADLKPWLLEVNISPSLHSSSSLDLCVKGPLIRDVFNMARFHVPEAIRSTGHKQLAVFVQANHPEQYEESRNYCLDLSLYKFELTPEEEKKQEEMMRDPTDANQVSATDGQWRVEGENAVKTSNILENLTNDDVRHLIECEDELSQAGGFTRIFPTAGTGSYMRFFEKIRYYDRLLHEWELKYSDKRREGIELLKRLSADLLPSVPSDGSHQCRLTRRRIGGAKRPSFPFFLSQSRTSRWRASHRKGFFV